MKKKSIAILAIALCLMFAVLWLLQALLVPKYMDQSKEGALIAEYYDNVGNNDVIFIGDCEVYENFSPLPFGKNTALPPISAAAPSS